VISIIFPCPLRSAGDDLSLIDTSVNGTAKLIREDLETDVSKQPQWQKGSFEMLKSSSRPRQNGNGRKQNADPKISHTSFQTMCPTRPVLIACIYVIQTDQPPLQSLLSKRAAGTPRWVSQVNRMGKLNKSRDIFHRRTATLRHS
jgi:hypothetical protein